MKTLITLLLSVLLFPLETPRKAHGQGQVLSPDSEFAIAKKDFLSLPAEQRARVRYMTAGFCTTGVVGKVNAVRFWTDAGGKIMGLEQDPKNPREHNVVERLITDAETVNRIAFFGLNSLSTAPTLMQAEFVPGTEKRMIRFFLNNYRIRNETWEFFAGTDPYFKHIIDPEVARQSGTYRLLIRSDWFLARAFVDPIYTQLLCNSLKFHDPKTEDEIHANFGFRTADSTAVEREYWASVSGEDSFVALQSRRLRRYQGVLDYLHISDDYKSNVDELRIVKGKKVYIIKDPVEHLVDPGIIQASPLTKNRVPFPVESVHEPDGHEAIWQLANGLQGYYISNAQGKLAGKADPELGVRDTRNSFEPVVANGRSCIWCHDRGINIPRNTAAQHLGKAIDFNTNSPEVLELLKSLYDSGYATKLLEDRSKYCTAVGIATGLDASENASQFRTIVQRYDYERITPEQAAKEVGVSVDELKQIASLSTSFRAQALFGTPPTPVPRKIWEVLYPQLLLIAKQQRR